MSPDATHLALVTDSEEGTKWIHMVDVPSGRLKAVHTGAGPLAWSPSSNTLAFQDSDGGILLWERSTNGDLVLTLSDHTDLASSFDFVFSPDGHLLVPVHEKGEIPLLVIDSYARSDKRQLRFSSDGAFREPADRNGEVPLLGTTTATSPLYNTTDKYSPSTDSRSLVTVFAASPNGRSIAALFESGLLIIYDADTGHETATLRTHVVDANHIEFSSDAEFIVLTFEPITRDFTSSAQPRSRQSEIWHTTARKMVYHSNTYQVLQFFPRCHDLVCASFCKALHVSSLNLDRPRLRGSEAPVSEDAMRMYPVTLSNQSNTRRIAAVNLDRGGVHVWNTEPPVSLGQLGIPQRYEGAPITQLALSADGLTLAATSLNCILIWVFESHDSSLPPMLVADESFEYPRTHHLSFSPDGQTLSYVANETQKSWNIASKQFMPIEYSLSNHWVGKREWHGNHYFCTLANPRCPGLYRVQDVAVIPEAVNNNDRLRCTNADGLTGIFSQPGFQIQIPPHKRPVSPIRLRLNETQGTASWYWMQKDGKLMILELPAP